MPLLLVVMLAGFAFRLARLDGLNIWGDEAASIWLASQPLSLLLTPGQETNPFAYPLLLHFWLPLAGRSVFSIRYLSLLVGVLLVPLAYRIGRDVAGQQTGLIATLLAALSAFAAAYSQEARMYALAATLCALATLALIRILHAAEAPVRKAGRRRLAWLFALYFASALAAAYTHYYALFILLGHGLYMLVRWRRYGRVTLIYLAVAALMAALFIPWNVAQLEVMAASQALKGAEVTAAGGLAPAALADILRETVTASFTGMTLPGRYDPLALIPAALALLGGILLITRHKGSPAAPLVVLLAFLPPLAAWLASPFFSFFHPRYLLIALPYLLLLLAAGLAWLGEKGHPALPVLLIAGLVGLNGASHWRAHHDPTAVRGRYADLMAVIASERREGDVILLDNGMQWALFDYYGVKDLPARTFPLPSGWESADTAAAIAAIGETYDRAWVVMFGDPAAYDPDFRLEGMLSETGFRAYHGGFIDSQLSLYLLGSLEADQPSSAVFGDQIALEAYGLSSDRLAPGDALRVSLRWGALAAPAADYTLFVHLVASDGTVIAQFDGPPAGGSSPTSGWLPGETIADQVAILLPDDAPAGPATLRVGWYLWPSLDHLLTADGQQACVLSEITISPP